MNGDVLTLSALAALAAAGLASRKGGSNTRKPTVLTDLTNYTGGEDVPGDLEILELPDGTVLRASDLLDVVDHENSSELSWLLFLHDDGHIAQRRLEQVGAWLESLRFPLVLWRGFNLPDSSEVQRQGHLSWDQHWTPNRSIAVNFAFGTDYGTHRPNLEPGTRPVLFQARLQDPLDVDWITTVYWFLAAGYYEGLPARQGPEEEVYVRPRAARQLMRDARQQKPCSPSRAPGQVSGSGARSSVVHYHGTTQEAVEGSAAKWTGPREAVKEAARQLRTGLRLTDVRVSRDTIYLMAPPRRLERLITRTDHESGHTLWSSGFELGQLLQSARVHRSTIDSYVRDVTHWNGLFGVVDLFMQEMGAARDLRNDWNNWTVRVVPKGGSPTVQTWSAKADRVIKPKKVEPFRFCKAGPIVHMGSSTGPALVQFADRSIDGFGVNSREPLNPRRSTWTYMLPRMFLSHGVAFDSFKAIEKCGGFLWPSFALTWRQPASYGDVVFLAPINVLQKALTPKWKTPFYLAGTDIWSPTARDLSRRQERITEQLRGRSDRVNQNDLLLSSSADPTWDNLVGAMSWDSPEDVDQTERITNRRDLVYALWEIMTDHVMEERRIISGIRLDPWSAQRHCHRPKIPAIYAYPPRPEWDAGGDRRYPYAELKVIGVVPVHNMVACFYPRQKRKRVHAFLDRQRFAGHRVPFDWSGPSKGDLSRGHAQHDALRREWAATVTRTILTWAEKRDASNQSATMTWPGQAPPSYFLTRP